MLRNMNKNRIENPNSKEVRDYKSSTTENTYKVVIVVVFILINLNVFGQNKINREISCIGELEVINSSLFLTLDTIIRMKEDIQYYKGTKFFIVELDEDITKPDLIFIRACEKIDYRYPSIIGFFYYQEHYFIIKGDSINCEIFQKTGKKRHFDFGLPSQRYTKEGNPITNQFEAFAVWSLRYKKDEFKILSFYTENDKDPWFNYIEKEYSVRKIH